MPNSTDQQLQYYIDHPSRIDVHLPGGADMMEQFGRHVMNLFLDSPSGEPIPELEIPLREQHRIRLQVNQYTVWVFDFAASDEYGISGKDLFIQAAKIPRQFMPMLSGQVRTIREYIYQRDVSIVVVDSASGANQHKILGYYLGILAFDGMEEKLLPLFPKDSQDRTLAEVWNVQVEEPEDQTQEIDNPEGLTYETINMEQDPETVAYQLIRQHLPKTFLNEIDISTDKGFSQLLACLMLRRHQCSLEKDEIIQFVQNNKDALNSRISMLTPLIQVMQTKDEGKEIAYFFNYFFEQIQHCIDNRYDLIDIKSDRLFWLLFTLGSQLSHNKITYVQAMQLLAKPVHRNRISPLTLQFILVDFAESVDTPNMPPVEYLMVTVECALMIDEPGTVTAGINIIIKLSLPVQRAALQDLLHRCVQYLRNKGKSVLELENYMHSLAGRFNKQIADDDL